MKTLTSVLEGLFGGSKHINPDRAMNVSKLQVGSDVWMVQQDYCINDYKPFMVSAKIDFMKPDDTMFRRSCVKWHLSSTEPIPGSIDYAGSDIILFKKHFSSAGVASFGDVNGTFAIYMLDQNYSPTKRYISFIGMFTSEADAEKALNILIKNHTYEGVQKEITKEFS